MTREEILKQALELPARDRMGLASDIWDSTVADPEAFQLTDAEKAELDRRLASFEADPSNTRSWEEVLERIRGRK